MNFKHHIPTRLRQNWKVGATACVGVVAAVALMGDDIVRPYVSSQSVSAAATVGSIQGTRTLFDDTSVHSIDVSFDETEYQEMLTEFQKDGTKNYIHATVTIDGTTLHDVGLRFKGNSTLQSLRGGDQGPRAGGPTNPDNNTDDPQVAPEQNGAPGMGGPSGVQLDGDSPEELPWLIKFDEFVEDQSYQGNYELSIRPQLASSQIALNEAVSLALAQESGQVTQDFAFSTVSVNGSEKAARIVVDHPDELWADSLGSGVLYKAKAGGSFDYLGDDLTEYEESFKQINGKGEADLSPVLKLLDFVNNSDDEEFAAHLDDYLDVDSFATYLATMEILGNQDAMDGPGNNYYLYFDDNTQKISVLSWDLNLSLGTSMGGGVLGGGGGPDGAQAQAPEADAAQNGLMSPPNLDESTGENSFMGRTPPMPGAQGGMPPMMQPNGQDTSTDGTDDRPTPPDGAAPGGMPGGQGSGILKQRFLANESFASLYQDAYADLYQTLIASGKAASIVETLASVGKQTGDTTVDAAAETITNYINGLSGTAPDPATTSRGRGMLAE